MNDEIENTEFESDDFEQVLRPKGFNDFQGQEQIVDNLKVFIQATRAQRCFRSRLITWSTRAWEDNTFLYYAFNELGVGIKTTSGPVLDKPDLNGLLTNLEERDVLFIDEIHRLNPIIEEYLYSAMEDYQIDIMIDSGPNVRSVQIKINPFTLIGATTRSGLLTAPLRS